MKRNLLALALMVINVSMYAQDVITEKGNIHIQAKVLEVTTTEVKYKKFDYQTGPTYTLRKADLVMIKYENGSTDVFSATPAKSGSSGSPNTKTQTTDSTKKEKPSMQQYKWGFGIGAGFTTGWGLSLKYQPRKDGIQLNAVPYINNNDKTELICVGLAYTHDLWDGEDCNVYFYLAGSYTYNTVNETSYSYYTYQQTSTLNTTRVINSGLGVGLSYNTKKRVVIDVMAGYAQYDSFKQLFLTGEISLHYKFGKS
jgi:hypothetical protein